MRRGNIERSDAGKRRAARSGRNRSSVTDAQRVEIRRLTFEGATAPEISRRVNLSISTVWRAADSIEVGVRCPTCGAKVKPPCLKCLIDQRREKGVL